ncbi:Pre-mRNA polyadenylation factor FIP1, partial [Lachnellula suecica]
MDDDDFYAPEDGKADTEPQQSEAAPEADSNSKQEDEDLEEGEEEDEGEEDSDSDIDIITERKDGSKAAPATQPRYNEIRNIPQRTTSSDVPVKPAAVKKESKDKDVVSGADLPGVSTSKIDVNAKPVYEPAGKRITEVNIDNDLNENDKPWRRPGTDVSDYFNYGFDEFTWALYASKQETLRSEYDNKKMFDDMGMMMMGGMPGMPAAGGALPGADGNMPPEMMQAMMQQIMASGMDPSQVDPASMYAAMQGQGAGGSGGAGGNQGQGYGGQGGFGQGQNQMDYGYGQGGGGNNRGGNFGRGRGGRRN